MLMLVAPAHGYAVMQQVEEMTGGQVIIGPGTLYGAFSALERDGLIEMVRKEDRRKIYGLTEKGLIVLQNQIKRLELMVCSSERIMGGETLSKGA